MKMRRFFSKMILNCEAIKKSLKFSEILFLHAFNI
jgi:hypothetical protein